MDERKRFATVNGKHNDSWIEERVVYLILRTLGWGVIAFMAAGTVSLLMGYTFEQAAEAIWLAAGYSAVTVGFWGGVFKEMHNS
jgi:hypothetical protein